MAFNFSPERFYCGQLVGARPRTASKLELGARVCQSSRLSCQRSMKHPRAIVSWMRPLEKLGFEGDNKESVSDKDRKVR